MDGWIRRGDEEVKGDLNKKEQKEDRGKGGGGGREDKRKTNMKERERGKETLTLGWA